MSYTMEDFRREYAKEIEEDRRERAKEVLKIWPPEKLAKVLVLAKRLKEKGLLPEEAFKGQTVEEVAQYLRSLQATTSSADTSSAPE